MATIRRGPRPADNYTIISNTAARDSRLTLRARGLLTLLSSHAVGFTTSLAALARQNPEGIDAIRKAVHELERYGYLVREEQARDEQGRVGESIWTLGEPSLDSPTTDNPSTGNPRAKEEQPQEHQDTEDETQQRRGRATNAQRAFLLDLHVRGGGASTPEFLAWMDTLSITQADAEIREARRVYERSM
ncbi:helix-turn-helix DNA binding domain protein [Microbacterium phage Nicole72]|uniref:Helix-turn-helix DNA binding domain protein n=1 Tax=Microbacterium phage Nicole72 TaxID=3062838 RepID=A0ACD4UJI1_9CAUD|nr:helix-turn-helix DNA binding domain protein [Microbacterium phage Nicole72]